MEQECASVLFEQGATLVFLDVPEKTEFGIDYDSWNVGSKFRGVKMIPPGVHFVYYSSVDAAHNNLSPRTGFLHDFQKTEVLVKVWDKQNETIKPGPISEEEQARVEANKHELDRYLGAYPYKNYSKWVALTNRMFALIVKQLQPLSGMIISTPMFESKASNTKQRQTSDTAATGSDGLPTMNHIPGTELRLTPIPKLKYPAGASPAEITKYNIDQSYLLEMLSQNSYSGNRNLILGELQFTFVLFLLGQVYDAFEQWKLLVNLMCSCEEAVETHSDLFVNFISVLHYHINEIPEDFFVDIVSCDNFLTSTLQRFFSNVFEGNASQKLKGKAERFRDHLEHKFQWDFTSDPEEFAPVVVE